MELFRRLLDQPRRVGKFIFYDIPGILYDYEPDGKAYLSLPRLMLGLSGFLIFVAYIREHFFNVSYENMSQLVMFFGGAASGYIGKRFANATIEKERIRHEHEDEEPEDERDGK
jgi:hypothetical protein